MVLAFVQKNHPKTISDLKRKLAHEGIRSTDQDLLTIIRDLQSDGSIKLASFHTDASFARFLIDPAASWWIYLVVLTSAFETLLVAINAQTGLLWEFRFLLGLGLLGLMPGYATVQILFPGDRLPELEQILLSIFLSVMVSIATGVALGAGYHFTGLSSVLALFVYTSAAVVFAGYRRYTAVAYNRSTRS